MNPFDDMCSICWLQKAEVGARKAEDRQRNDLLPHYGSQIRIAAIIQLHFRLYLCNIKQGEKPDGLQMEDMFGRIKKNVWPCMCGDTYVKMYYAYPFHKNVWPLYGKQKISMAVIK
jgi:hypothetical protein